MFDNNWDNNQDNNWNPDNNLQDFTGQDSDAAAAIDPLPNVSDDTKTAAINLATMDVDTTVYTKKDVLSICDTLLSLTDIDDEVKKIIAGFMGKNSMSDPELAIALTPAENDTEITDAWQFVTDCVKNVFTIYTELKPGANPSFTAGVEFMKSVDTLDSEARRFFSRGMNRLARAASTDEVKVKNLSTAKSQDTTDIVTNLMEQMSAIMSTDNGRHLVTALLKVM